MNTTVPPEVKAIARREACNCINYCGKIDDFDVYSISEVGEDGDTIPTGLPYLVLWDGKVTKEIDGMDALKLLSQL